MVIVFPLAWISFTKIGLDHMELQDTHGNTIHLMQEGMGQMTQPTNESSYRVGYVHGISDANMEKMNPTSHSLYIVHSGYYRRPYSEHP